MLYDCNLETTTNLYKLDYLIWLLKTIEQIQNKDFDSVDWKILIEELEGLVSSTRRELKSRLIVLLMHLVKYQYQPEKRSSSWVRTILEQRLQIELLLEDSPSLKPYYLEIFSDCYSKAIKEAVGETKLPISAFPAESPFQPEDAINSDFIFSLVNQEES